MIRVIKKNKKLILEYYPEQRDIDWIDQKLSKDGEVHLSRVFHFLPKHIIKDDEDSHYASDSKAFLLGNLEGEYYRIDKNILRINFDLLLSKDMSITDKTFLATGRISIFRRIDELVKEQIAIGGSRENAIPKSDFKNLLDNFPTKTELEHYSSSRISGILKDYLGTITDAQAKLNKYLSRKKKIKATLELSSIYENEAQKYSFIRDRITEMLEDPDPYVERDWQDKILEFILILFPKYVTVLRNVQVKDYYSIPGETKDRYIDLALVDANGHIDIIEIKKPFANCVLSTLQYRDNYTPKKELSGAVMQAEKYLFHLNKWGFAGETELNKKHGDQLPNNLKIKVVNPKAIIILGRSYDFANAQKFDFEIIKRKYANVMDILTYDDLLERLKNIIARFEVPK